jgi:hypothetical protein
MVCAGRSGWSRGRQLPGQHQRLSGQAREKVVEGVAGGQNDTADAARLLARQKLDNGPARVVADNGDVVQVETVKKLRDEAGNASERQVRAGVHGPAVPSERERDRIDGERFLVLNTSI